MKEDLLQHIWKFKRFDHTDLKSADGQAIQILDYGMHNHNAGPDFINARVRIAGTLWLGHIEIHIYASQWYAHGHMNDPNYNNVILHVVLKNDSVVKALNGNLIPCLELEDRIDEALVKKHNTLFQSQLFIPCQNSIYHLDKEILFLYSNRLLISRLERKYTFIQSLLEQYKNDWEQLCFALLLRYVGTHVNKEAFSILSSRIPHKLLLRHSCNLTELEALFLGQAGLIGEGLDGYTQNINGIYSHLKRKYRLNPMSGIQWKFSRMRPRNFPTLRLAQIAGLYFRYPRLFSKLLNEVSVNNYYKILNIQASAYWSYHYIPDRKTRKHTSFLGKQTRGILILNAILPLVFSYAMQRSDASILEKCLQSYSDTPPENNNIIRLWKSLDIHPENAGHSQAFIELKTQFCDRFKCLNCQIGTKLLFE